MQSAGVAIGYGGFGFVLRIRRSVILSELFQVAEAAVDGVLETLLVFGEAFEIRVAGVGA